MFLSVKERARQIANGQLTAQPPAAQINQPPPKVTIPRGASAAKAAAEKPPSPKAAAPKAAAPKPAPAKAAPTPKPSASKPPPPKSSSAKTTTPIGAFPDSAPPKLSRSKTEPPKSPKTKKSSSSKEKEKEKEAPSRPKLSRAETAKTASSSSKKTPSKTAAAKSVPVTPVRSSFFSRIASGSSSSSADSSTDEETPKSAPSDDITELKTAIMKQVSGVTGLGGKSLAVVCRQTSKNRQWYAALKDVGSDKYLKMWMNRDKTYPTPVEALQAYLVFAKKMKDSCRLFPMSPAGTKMK